MQLSSKLNLIDTSGLSYNLNVTMEFKNIIFVNIGSSTTGNLLSFGHQLPKTLIVRDSSFKNLNSAGIVVGITTSVSDAQTTKVTFINNQFDSFYSESRSFVSVYKEAIAEFLNCTFTNMHTLSSGAAITAGASKARVIVSDSTFTNNSAVDGSVFNIESESFIRWNTCSFISNFALTSGVVRINSNGYFYFYDSLITQNYAKNNPISLVFDSVNLSILDKWQIYENSMMDLNQILAEINTRCSVLCFLISPLKQYINSNKETIQSEASSRALIQLISGSVKVLNFTHVHHQDAIINAFVSTVVFENSTISQINMTVNWIEIVSSSLTFSGMDVTAISNLGQNEFIDISSESSMAISNVMYNDSDSILFNLRSSEATIQNVTIENVQDAHHLFELYDTKNVRMSGFNIFNSSSVSESMVSIKNSDQISVNDFIFDGVEKTILIIEKTFLTEIKNLRISKSFSPVSIKDSTIELLSNSIFMDNTSKNTSVGGALNLYNSDVRIVNSTFANNTAESGGAIHFDWNSMALCNLDVSNSIFFQNNATAKGGAIYYAFKRPQLTNVTNQNNSAPYGPNLASYAVKIKMVGSNEMVIDDIGSNIKYEKEVKLALLDYDDQVMVLNNANQITLNPVDTAISSIGGVNSVLLRDGIATFNNLIAVAKYGSQAVQYQASSKGIDNNKVKQVHKDWVCNNIITFNFRNCKPGESIIDGYKCHECSVGSYSLDWNSPKCISCMDDAVCLGKDEIEINPGFWRMTTNSTKIVQWLNEDACDGGYNSKKEHPVNWAEGYSGVLWTEWQISGSTKYQKVNDFECQKCPNMVLNTIRVVGVGLLVFIFFMIIIVINVRKTKESEVSVLFRIMANYLQLLTTSMAFSSSFPDSLTNLFSPVKRVGGASDTFLSFDCFITDYEIRGPFPSNVLFKLFLAAFLPIILTLLVSAIWIAIYFAFRKWVPDLKRYLIISFISVVFLLHPKLAEQSFSLFRCIEVDYGERRVRIDASIEWYSTEHVSWLMLLSMPILIVWVTSCPLIALYLLFTSIKKDESNKVKKYLLILYQGLKRDRFYWEFVNTLRKVILLFILMLSDTLKILFSATLLYITIRLQIYLKPYRDEANNKIEILALTSGLVTLLSSIVFISEDSVALLDLCLLIMIVIINAKFILEWSYKMILWASKKSRFFKIVSHSVAIL
jgi:hypothetical protein